MLIFSIKTNSYDKEHSFFVIHYKVAESIRRLRDEDSVSGLSEENTGQPPTPSSTPGPVGAHQVPIQF